VEGISVDQSGSSISLTEVKITESGSDSSVDIQALQWVELKNLGLPYITNHLSRDCDNLE
jgi:hypothetical protein